MEGLQVFSGGTGRLQLDSNGGVVDVNGDLATTDFRAGVLLYLDENNQTVRCRFLARRRSPEQFLAVFKSDGNTDILDRFKNVLKKTVHGAGWRIERDDEWTGEVFDAFGETAPKQPSDPIIQRIIGEYDRVTLGVPTEHDALRLLEHCREELDEPTVAVCAGERPEHLSETTVVIQPNAEYDRVVPVGQTATRVRREMAEEAYGDLRSALAALAETLEENVEKPRRREVLMAITLRRVGVEDDNWAIVHESRSGRSWSVAETLGAVLNIGEGGSEDDEIDLEEVVDGPTLEALSAATSELRTWTSAQEFRRAIGRLLDRHPIEIEDE